MVNLVTVRDVELMKTGTWNISTGEWEVTPELIQAAISAHNSGVLRKPVIRIGHNDPRFTGDPAVGYIDNVRASEDGSTLLGDMVGVPEWLGDIMASAYPDRSIEGLYDYSAPDGSSHPFVLTGLALLGATAPGVSSLKSLQDVARLYDIAAAGQVGGTAIEFTIHAAADSKPYGDVEYADTKNNKYPIDTKEHVRAAWSYINMPKNQSAYSSSELATIKSKIKAAAKKFDIQIEAATAAPEKGEVVMASLQEQLAQRLGLEAGADEAAVLEAFEEKFGTKDDEGAEAAEVELGDGKADEQPVAASAAPDMVQLSRDQYTTIMAAAQEVQKIRAEQAAEARETLVMAAIGDGRITPASKSDWLKALEVDPGGHNRTALASLAPGLVPVAEIGHAIASEATDSEQADKERMFAIITGQPTRKDA